LAKSHRTSKDGELIRWESQQSAVRVGFSRLGVGNVIDLKFSRTKRRQMLLNGHAVAPKSLVGSLTTVLFSPEDLYLVKGAPQLRRAFLDTEISQTSPAYYRELNKYNRLIIQRNNLLKKIREGEAGRDMLELWDAQLAESAARIAARRLESVNRLAMLGRLMQRRISGSLENLEVSYDLHAPSGETGPVLEPGRVTERLIPWYNEMLNKRHELDIIRGVTSVGPHRDDLRLSVNGVDLRTYGSQGQQRTAALSLKLAEINMVREIIHDDQVLLLDDVLSELDRKRQGFLLDSIGDIQTFITCTGIDDFVNDRFVMNRVFYVENGNVRQMS
jgi:DNA replication and repair protein RecF